ncbi:molybdenum cofactor guanylyltransferase [Halobacillus yeomjeoni]|uniref:molybdenum cofactor guanylyltransferase n=1 Tax=Halobacillus yeomjeoni TaxID=311194 RepID=UPI001CD43D09|nr:molybdenum cofactor guanylyltransferase [Halobacillus yeomjeoni]MCA0983085.1 molybdenum cofactor guanylyltransferase [Halobacillus yeomjeoni]
MKNTACGVIIAGGGSTRMGQDKAGLPLGDSTTIERIAKEMRKVVPAVVLNQNQPRDSALPIIKDEVNDAGPLGGMHAVLKERNETWFAITACDTPFIRAEVYRYLLHQRLNFQDAEAIIPVWEGRKQPLSGIYHRDILENLEKLLEKGKRRFSDLFECVEAVYIHEFTDLSNEHLTLHFFNMNTPEDYVKAKRIMVHSRHSI